MTFGTNTPAREVRARKWRLLDAEIRWMEAVERHPPKRRSPAAAAILARFGVRLPCLAKPRRCVCGAKTRKGKPCMALALANGRCRHHGGLSTGPKTAEGWARTWAGYRTWRERQKAARDRNKSEQGGPHLVAG